MSASSKLREWFGVRSKFESAVADPVANDADEARKAARALDRGNHLRIFIAILYGLVVRDLFDVWHLLPTDHPWLALRSPPAVLTACMTLLILQYWWAVFESISTIGKSLLAFLLAVLQTLLFYLTASYLKSLFSGAQGKTDSLLALYSARHALFFGFGLLIVGSLLLDGKKDFSTISLRITALAICLALIVMPGLTVHYVFSYVLLAIVVAFIILRRKT